MGKAQAQLGGTGQPDARQIKHDIELTRARMDRTVDELTCQLSPRRFIQDILARFGATGPGGHYVRSGAAAAGKWLLRGVGRHPLPSAVIGSGVAWLVMDTRRKRAKLREISYPYEEDIPGEIMMSTEPGFEQPTSPERREELSHEIEGEQPITGFAQEGESRVEKAKGRASEAASRAKAKASQTAGKVSEWSREKAHRLREKSGHAREKLSEQTFHMRQEMRQRLDSGRERASELVDEYPLLIGVSAMAVGLVIGLLIPPSRPEQRVLGPKASRLREKAEHLVERGKEAVRTTAEAMKEEARRQGLTPSDVSERVEKVAHEGTEAVKQEMHREQNRPL